MLKKLPIGIQTFSEIVENDLLYIDKTKIALDLLENSKYVFLARPRRFGKSLFLDTLHNIFEANKILFNGLYIENKWGWETQYPVIKLSFSGNRTKHELLNSIFNQLQNNQERLLVDYEKSDDFAISFSRLIDKTQKKHQQKVVILVDEYDKPILDNLDQLDVALECRDILKRLYTQIKDNDQYIKFAMLTGVSKFSKVSVFSGLNNLEDISLEPRYGSICGYTENNLDIDFKPYLDDIDRNEVRHWYNGYNFFGDKVYNPYDILLFIKNEKTFKNYWFETATPSFLINLIKQNQYFLPRFENLIVEESLTNSFEIENLSLETVMFQSGYLTIKERIVDKRKKIAYQLDFPNYEVKISFYDYLLRLSVNVADKTPITNTLYDILEEAQMDQLEAILKRLFASIAYNNFTKNNLQNYEGFYASVLYAYFASLGLKIIAEDVTNQGRIDLTLIINDKIYIFEFKVIKENPLKQVKEKRYFDKYSGEIYIIGIVFDAKQRNISQFEWEKICKT
jgi:hypothetical protein